MADDILLCSTQTVLRFEGGGDAFQRDVLDRNGRSQPFSRSFDSLMRHYGLTARLPKNRDYYSHHSTGRKYGEGTTDELLRALDPEIGRLVRCIYREDLCLLGYNSTDGRWDSNGAAAVVGAGVVDKDENRSAGSFAVQRAMCEV